MTDAKSNKVTKIKAAASSAPKAATMEIGGTIVAFNDAALKSLSIVASAILFAAPQFANQTTPSNVLGLADLMYKYAVGEVTAEQPKEGATPTFG